MPADLFGVLRASHERRSRSEPADRVPGISVARMPVLDPAVVKGSYRFGEALGQETQTIEFKGTRDAENDMLRVLKDKISRYLCAFLNSAGGAILFGVDDDGIVRGGQLGSAQRAAAVKLIDAAAQLIDPQVEPDAIMPPRFVPVADAPQPDTCVLLVVVLRGRQPVYYLSPHSTDAFLRRHESVFRMEWSLVRQREAAAATPVRRSWRHIAGRLLPFDPHIADLRARLCPSRVPRLWAMRRLAAMLAAADCPRLLLLRGASGSGKSTLAGAIVQHGLSRRREEESDGWKNVAVAGCHFSISDRDAAATGAFVQHVAASLIASPYTSAFKRAALASPLEILHIIETPDAVVAFRSLLRLLGRLRPTHGRRLLFIVDGADAADVSVADGGDAARRNVASLVRRGAKDAPDWLTFLLTSHNPRAPPPAGGGQGGGQEGGGQGGGALLDLDSADGCADVAEYIRGRVAAEPVLAAAVGGASAGLLSAEALVRASRSSFAFARTVLDMAWSARGAESRRGRRPSSRPGASRCSRGLTSSRPSRASSLRSAAAARTPTPTRTTVSFRCASRRSSLAAGPASCVRCSSCCLRPGGGSLRRTCPGHVRDMSETCPRHVP